MTAPFVHPDRDLKDDDALARALIDTSTWVRRAFPRARDGGLAPHELQVLLAVHLQPGSTVNELVDQLSLTRPRTSRAIGLLISEGLAQADRRDFEDGRRRPYVVTDAGAEVVGALLAKTRQRLQDGPDAD